MKNREKKKRISYARIIVNFFIVFYVILYFTTFLPVLKFMNNSLPENYGDSEESTYEPIILNSGEPLIDPGELDTTPSPTPEITPESTAEQPSATPYETEGTIMPSETPDYTQDPEQTPRPTENIIISSEPVETPANQTSIPYVPDPYVEGVTKTVGNNIKLETDAKNVLILGYDARSGLTDTIMILSVSEKTKSIQLLSLARDAYVPYTGSVKEYLLKTKLHYAPGIYKLNCCYKIGNMTNYSGGKFSNKGVNFLCNVLSQLMPNANVDIDDYIFIDVNGLEQLIDLFGGANVYYSEDYYILLNKDTGETELKYKKGYHFVDGKEAVLYLQRRNRYDASGQISSSGDSYRKANQLRFIKDFSQQVITFENIARVNEIMSSVSKLCYHSINTAAEIAEYTKIATKYSQGYYTMNSVVVSGSYMDPLGDHASYVNLMK